MNRKIVITSCGVCPHVDHAGGFGQIKYIPVCGVNGRKKLPYTEVCQNETMMVAQGTGVIPDWCPLALDVPPVVEPGCEHRTAQDMGDHIQCINCSMVKTASDKYTHAGGVWFTNMDDARAYEERWDAVQPETGR